MWSQPAAAAGETAACHHEPQREPRLQEPDAQPGAALPAAGAPPVVLDAGGGQGRDPSHMTSPKVWIY